MADVNPAGNPTTIITLNHQYHLETDKFNLVMYGNMPLLTGDR